MRVLIGAFERCDDSSAIASNILPNGPDQSTELCFKNAMNNYRELVIAVSRYSGEQNCNQIMYYLSHAIESGPGCGCIDLR